MKIKLLLLILLIINVVAHAQPADHGLSIEIEGLGNFIDGSTATLKANKEYKLIAKWKRTCLNRTITWSRLVNSTEESCRISLGAGQSNWIQVDMSSTSTSGGSPCPADSRCLVYLKTPGGTSTATKPVPDFSMNGSTAKSITIKPNTEVIFRDLSTNKPTRWRYSVMYVSVRPAKRFHYTKTNVQHTKFTFTKAGNYEVYFWAGNSAGQKNAIFKNVVVK